MKSNRALYMVICYREVKTLLLIKTFHLFFVISWFACLFYLPRLFVNHAQNIAEDKREMLLGMEARLIKMMKFTLIGTVVSAAFLVYSLTGSQWLIYVQQGWFISKMVLVVLLLVYHQWCIKIHHNFAVNKEQHSHVWFRVFNELPVFVLFAVIYLVLAKPF